MLGLDLRKPKLGLYMDDTAEGKGVTNYLIGQNSVDEIVKTYTAVPNLHYITSGPVPPNPAELILSKKMESLLQELSKEYDYILIDTPPIGLVSDALLLRNLVDNILVVVRHKYTHKGMVKQLDRMYQDKELDRASIIFNGVKQGKGYGYGAYQLRVPMRLSFKLISPKPKVVQRNLFGSIFLMKIKPVLIIGNGCLFLKSNGSV